MSDSVSDLAALPNHPTVPNHPDSRLLSRYASNEVGRRRKKTIAAHLEECSACQDTVRRVREAARRFRDFERLALTRFALAQDSDRLPPSL